MVIRELGVWIQGPAPGCLEDCVKPGVNWGSAAVFQGCFCSHTNNLCSCIYSGWCELSSQLPFQTKSEKANLLSAVLFFLSSSFSDSQCSLTLLSFLETSCQPHPLLWPTKCVDLHTWIQSMIFLTQALLLSLPLLFIYLFIYCFFLGQIHSQITCPSSHHPQGRSVGSRFVSAWVLLELVCLLEHCLSSWVVSWARVPVSPLLTLKWSQNSTSPCSRTEQPLNTKIPRVKKGSCLLVILVCLWCALLLD